MKRELILSVAALMTVVSCGTYAGSGAYVGASLGSVLGSAIGGISGGPRGSDVGTIVGMATGAVVGSSIGAQADQQRQEDRAQYRYDKEQRRQARERRQSSSNYYNDGYSDSGFDPNNSGDDRIYDFNGSDYTTDYSAGKPDVVMPGASSVEHLNSNYSYAPHVEIVNARFVDDNRDNVINRGELCKVIFEIYNRGNQTVYDVQPIVVEADGNRHLAISPSIHVERIEPGRGVRYTALVKADNRLRDGRAKICVSVMHGGKTISKVSEFDIATRK